MPPILTIDRVVKRFGSITAVDGVSLSVEEGEILALLGPNGAGKTTLTRLVLGIIRPDSGSITHFLTGAASQDVAKWLLGYLPEERGLYQDMPILRTLTYFGVLHGMDAKDAERAAMPWLERFGLADRVKEPVKSLSKGNQQKVQLAATVLHRPRFALLDEPFSGLDPINQELLVDIVRELRDAGTTVVFSAHQMPLVERLADRVILMNRGREVLHGTIPEIRERWRAGDRLVVGIRSGDAADLVAHPAVESVERTTSGEVAMRLRRDAPLSDLLRTLGERFEVTHVRSEAVTLHEIYVQTVGDTDAASDVAANGGAR
jgi:ABC-2 type transport system ATP-binding protein